MTLQQFIKQKGMYHSINYNEDCGCDYENQSYYKEEFKKVGRSFLKRIAKDISFDSVDIHYNQAGIACSGDHTLIGMKGTNGIYISFNTDGIKDGMLYRTAKHMKDWTGGTNHFVSLTEEYNIMLKKFKKCLGIFEE